MALIRGHKADRWGNLTYFGTNRNFNPAMAAAADLVIAEVDAIVPASEAAQAAVGAGLLAVAQASAAGAHKGKDDTVEMIASFGKAKALGERAKGHPDPGALSTTILLDAARDYVKGQS